MNKENRIYMAYGSNLNQEQMKHRCPHATVLGSAMLQDYKLVFRGNPGRAVATIEPEQGSKVPVLLWDITPRDEEALDQYEGWPILYRKELLEIQAEERTVSAMVYIMNERYALNQPNDRYLNTISQGYETFGLDKKILLQAVEIFHE